MTHDAVQPPSRLARQLGTFDTVTIGLGAMIGAGVFAAIGPAAEAAGGGLLIGLALAATVAYCNATSSARLAARYPASGGTYVYGRERLGHLWGFLAGWGFVAGKTASCAAIALTFGAYTSPDLTRPLAIGAVIALTTVALLFFAFAGYARIATLGEEVRDPAHTIPRAVPIALGITLAVYTVVAFAALIAVGPDTLASAAAPLTAVVEAGTLAFAVPVVRIGAAIGSLGVLLSLLVGVSRTTFAMASERDLPRWLDAVHTTRRVPHRAELAVAVAVIVVVLVADVRGAIGFSSFAVLIYYGVANASAFTLRTDERRSPRVVPVVGLIGCVVLGCALPAPSIIGGSVLLATGALVWVTRRRTPTATTEVPTRNAGVPT